LKKKIVGLGLVVCLGTLIVVSVLVLVWKIARDGSPPSVSVTGSSATPTTVARPSCLTLSKPVGNTVCGYIINETDGAPVVGRPVFLAKALFSSDKSLVLASLDQFAAPKGITNENGMFCVVDVPTDMYFLLLGDYPQPIMLRDPKNPAHDLTVDWRQSKGTVDVGVIPVQLVISVLP
jgi:hypothetical protein